MKKYFILLALLSTACAGLPVSPSELKPSPNRRADISTQEAILPNTAYEQMLARMKAYSDQCLNKTSEVSCGRNCTNTYKFTGTIAMEKNKLTLFLQKKGGTGHFGDMPADGVYLMMAEATTNGKMQQLKVHGFESAQHGYTTQSTIDWLSERKKVCPRL